MEENGEGDTCENQTFNFSYLSSIEGGEENSVFKLDFIACV